MGYLKFVTITVGVAILAILVSFYIVKEGTKRTRYSLFINVLTVYHKHYAKIILNKILSTIFMIRHIKKIKVSLCGMLKIKGIYLYILKLSYFRHHSVHV